MDDLFINTEVWRNKEDFIAYKRILSENLQAAITNNKELKDIIKSKNIINLKMYNPKFECENFDQLIDSTNEIEVPGSLFFNLYTSTPLYTPITIMAICGEVEDNANSAYIRYAEGQIGRLDLIEKHARTYDTQVFDTTKLFKLIQNYDDNVRRRTRRYLCSTSGDLAEQVSQQHRNKRASSKDAVFNALDIVYASARRALSKLRQRYSSVRIARTNFEQRADGGGGVRAIEESHELFLQAKNDLLKFRLGKAPGYDPQPIFDEARKVVMNETKVSQISELDRLRNEYVEKRIPTPAPSAFTQSARSQRFSFSELNNGPYSWAILTDRLLTNLDLLAEEMDRAGYRIQLNSVYRNPNHRVSSGRSQHQYGTAVDIQVFDFDQSGGIRNDADWILLRNITDQLSPSYTEPLTQSGPGHVHVDWR